MLTFVTTSGNKKFLNKPYNNCMTLIIGVKIPNRISTSPIFQDIISKYGCIIKTRIGLHSNCSNVCANYGIILLEIVDGSEIVGLKKALSSIEGISIDSINL